MHFCMYEPAQFVASGPIVPTGSNPRADAGRRCLLCEVKRERRGAFALQGRYSIRESHKAHRAPVEPRRDLSKLSLWSQWARELLPVGRFDSRAVNS
jgi:hypothetical protein